MPDETRKAKIYTAPLSAVEEVIARRGVTHLVSLLNPSAMIETPAGIDRAHHLRLGFSDSAVEQEGAAGASHAEDLVSFVRGWDGRGSLLIHCLAGVSRSTAAGFIALCCLNEETSEAEAARVLRRSAAHASPNRLLVRLGDRTLGREGRMVRAIEALPPAQPVWEGVVSEFPARIPVRRG